MLRSGGPPTHGRAIQFGVAKDNRYYVKCYEYLVVGKDLNGMLSLYVAAALSYESYSLRWSCDELPFEFNPDTDMREYPVVDGMLYRTAKQLAERLVENGAQMWFHEDADASYFQPDDERAAA